MDRERLLKLLERVENARNEFEDATHAATLVTTRVTDAQRNLQIAKGELDKALGLK